MHRPLRLALTTLPLILAQAAAGTHVWTGASSGFWSDPLNWTGGAPQPGEPPPVILRIPAAAASHRDLTNDIPGLTVHELLVAAHANTLHAAPGVRLGLKNATLTADAISTILENAGTTPTLGQFDNLPEGALLTMTENSQTDLLARISYHGGDGNDVTLTLVEPPPGGHLAGPWLLKNGWLQILGGIREFDRLLPHRWESTDDPSQPAKWTPFGPDFIPLEHGTLLTITNTASLPRRFFRLALPNL